MTVNDRSPGSDPGRGPGSRAVAGGFALSAVSQGLSSVTNLGLTILLVMVAEPDELGRWVAAISVYLLAMTLVRSTVTEPMVAAAGPGDESGRNAAEDRWMAARRRIARATAGAMVGLTAVAVAVGVPAAGIALLAGSLPFLLRQDGQRYLAWALHRPMAAVGLDVWWLAVSTAVLAGIRLGTGGLTPTAAVAAWAVGGGSGAVVGRWALERWPADGRPAATGRGRTASHRTGRTRVAAGAGPDRPVSRLAWSQGLFACAFNALPVVVALVVSTAAAGTVRTLLLPFAPVLSLMAGVRVVTLPLMTRAGDLVEPTVRRLVVSGVGVSAVVGSLGIAAVRRIPESLLGPALIEVRPHLAWGVVLCTLYVAAQFLADGVAIGRRSPRVVGHRIVTIGLEWVGLLGGAAVGGVGAVAAGWSLGLAAAVTWWLAAWWWPRPAPSMAESRLPVGSAVTGSP